MHRAATMIDLDALAGLGLLAYLLVFGFAALDVVFPLLPSEATVILAGVLAWQGRLSIAAVGLAAAAGAIVGGSPWACRSRAWPSSPSAASAATDSPRPRSWPPTTTSPPDADGPLGL